MRDSNHLVVLVDGSSYLFRAFHAFELTNKQGQPTGALHGVGRMLLRLFDDYQPAYFGVIFDAKGKTFRHQLFPEYKANRPAVPEKLVSQIKPLHDLIEAMGFALIVKTGVEADDVIGTLAKQALNDNYQVVISSGDKDMTQLLTSPDITLLDTMKNAITTQDDVATRFKVDNLRADQVVDFLALAGDKADNIIGIDKVGSKIAAKLLAEYQTLDNLINNASKIKGKIGENLRAGIEKLKISQQLAKIITDVELDITIQDLAVKNPNLTKLELLCDQFELNNLKKRFIKNSTNAITPVNQSVNYSTDKKELFERLQNIDLISFYINYDNKAINFYLDKNHYQINLTQEDIANLATIFNQSDATKITFDAKAVYHFFDEYDVDIKAEIIDIMLMSYVINSTNKHDLESLSNFYLNHQTNDNLVGAIFNLYHFFNQELTDKPKLQKLFYELEQPLIKNLFQTEKNGVKIDADLLQKQSFDLENQLIELEKNAHELAGNKFNLQSPKQVQEILFDKLQLKPIVKTPKGQPSTNEEALQRLREFHDLPEIILKHREIAKLKSTYTDKLPKLINPKTNRLHTSYHQAITSTGRLSSSNPNLQNIPIKNQLGRKIRQAFIAKEGYQLLAADYSQIELRIMAHLSKDPRLIDAFNNQQDVHSRTAAEIFNVEADEVTKEQRRSAKAINFGLIYGMSSFGLAKQLQITNQQANQYIERYFAHYPLVRDYMNQSRKQAYDYGFVETLWGRRLYLPDIKSKNIPKRNAAERLAINAPMQGTAADIIKKAMNDICAQYQNNPDIRLIMQVHDELVFEVKNELAKKALIDITQIMEKAGELSIKLVVEAKLGQHWEEAH